MHVSSQREGFLEEGFLPFSAKQMGLTQYSKVATEDEEHRWSPNASRPIKDDVTLIDAAEQQSAYNCSESLRRSRKGHFHVNNDVESPSLGYQPQPPSLDHTTGRKVESHLEVNNLLDDLTYSMSRYLADEPSRLIQLALHGSRGTFALEEGQNRKSNITLNFNPMEGSDQGMKSASLVAFAGDWAQYVFVRTVHIMSGLMKMRCAGHMEFHIKIITHSLRT